MKHWDNCDANFRKSHIETKLTLRMPLRSLHDVDRERDREIFICLSSGQPVHVHLVPNLSRTRRLIFSSFKKFHFNSHNFLFQKKPIIENVRFRRKILKKYHKICRNVFCLFASLFLFLTSNHIDFKIVWAYANTQAYLHFSLQVCLCMYVICFTSKRLGTQCFIQLPSYFDHSNSLVLKPFDSTLSSLHVCGELKRTG